MSCPTLIEFFCERNDFKNVKKIYKKYPLFYQNNTIIRKCVEIAIEKNNFEIVDFITSQNIRFYHYFYLKYLNIFMNVRECEYKEHINELVSFIQQNKTTILNSISHTLLRETIIDIFDFFESEKPNRNIYRDIFYKRYTYDIFQYFIDDISIYLPFSTQEIKKYVNSSKNGTEFSTWLVTSPIFVYYNYSNFENSKTIHIPDYDYYKNLYYDMRDRIDFMYLAKTRIDIYIGYYSDYYYNIMRDETETIKDIIVEKYYSLEVIYFVLGYYFLKKDYKQVVKLCDDYGVRINVHNFPRIVMRIIYNKGITSYTDFLADKNNYKYIQDIDVIFLEKLDPELMNHECKSIIKEKYVFNCLDIYNMDKIKKNIDCLVAEKKYQIIDFLIREIEYYKKYIDDDIDVNKITDSEYKKIVLDIKINNLKPGRLTKKAN